MKTQISRFVLAALLTLGLASTSRACFMATHGHGVQTLDDIVDVSTTSVGALSAPAVNGSDVWDYRSYLYGGNKVSIDFDTDYGVHNTPIVCGYYNTSDSVNLTLF